MNDIEQLLSSDSSPKPRRELSSDFTAQIIDHITVNPVRRRSLKEYFVMNLHKPAFAAVTIALGVILLGGTAYATTDGFTKLPSFLNVFVTSEQQTQDGGKIVTLNTKSCATERWDDQRKSLSTADETLYYRINPKSNISAKDLAQWLQGECELSANAQHRTEIVIPELEQRDLLNKTQQVVGGYMDDEITAISPSSVTLVTKMPFVGATPQESKTITTTTVYDTIAPNILVEEDGRTIAWSDLKVGDSVSVIYRTAAWNESFTPEQSKSLPKTLVYVSRNAPNVASAARLSREHYFEFEQVKPCVDNSRDFCSLTDQSRSSVTQTSVVEEVYNHYLKDITTENTMATAQQNFLEHVSPELAIKIQHSKQLPVVVCAQNTPQSFSFGAPIKVDDQYHVIVTAHFSRDTSTINVAYKDNLITDISCQ